MDPEIQELKELVRQNTKLAEETNKTVRKMHRNLWWGRILTLLWWAAVLGVFGATYYYFLQPYVEQILALYGQAEGWRGQMQEFFNQFGSQQ